MRKALLGVLTTVAVLSVGATTAFAAGSESGRSFIDMDGDGVCDNAGSMCVYADADGDGICDVCGASHGICLTGNGAVFADTDGDSICDNCGAYHGCGMAGTGYSGNFVDADGDGICDNYGSGGSGQCRGDGCGRRSGSRGGRGR